MKGSENKWSWPVLRHSRSVCFGAVPGLFAKVLFSSFESLGTGSSGSVAYP
jgi:hypothetical protein